ncbi:hypothetical protein QCA50_012573 [Cerrena zonata]|uniref:Uncharacterized protein n=1 Tax=Cerrena zonata TaxID=2478898 RepID=A0AAW0G1J0_9APHY
MKVLAPFAQNGPRHDNDFVEIDELRVAPTHDELLSRIPIYLPANLHAAPHLYAPESMERLLVPDIHLLASLPLTDLRGLAISV